MSTEATPAAHNFASNAEIDQAIEAYLVLSSRPGVPSGSIGSHLSSRFAGRLRASPKDVGKPHWIACEHANRGCQRLKKASKVTFDRRAGWKPVTQS